MKALVKAKAEKGLWMEDQPMPKMGSDDVMIKIKATAICGTDMHIYNWDEWAQNTIPVPMIVGHEYVGEIVEVGANVKGLKIGQRVSGEGHIVCGHCRNCRGGRQHLCQDTIGVGVNRPGSFAEFLSIPASNVINLTNDIDDRTAAILDPLGNATHTALSFDLVGEDVLITGAGPIGIMAAAIAVHAGARRVVITDINDDRLKLAKSLGDKIWPYNVANISIKEILRDSGLDVGFDVGLEMSGNPIALKDMVEVMITGGRIALLGIPPSETSVNWSHIILKGLTLKGIYGREMYETWYKMMAMLRSGLNIAPIITHDYPIDDFQKGFDMMNSGKSGKVILHW